MFVSILTASPARRIPWAPAQYGQHGQLYLTTINCNYGAEESNRTVVIVGHAQPLHFALDGFTTFWSVLARIRRHGTITLFSDWMSTFDPLAFAAHDNVRTILLGNYCISQLWLVFPPTLKSLFLIAELVRCIWYLHNLCCKGIKLYCNTYWECVK